MRFSSCLAVCRSVVGTVLLLTVMGLSAPLGAQEGDRFVTIGTASVTGVYYPAGGAICRLVNRDRAEHKIRCTVESTNGSIDNLNTIRQGDLDFGIVQSDWQYHASKGDNIFADVGPFSKLRSVFSLHNEAFTLVARADSKIFALNDLRGKRVNIGNPGSGMRATMEEIMRLKGWTKADFKQIGELRVMEQGKALCGNKVDAIIFSGGNPNGVVQEVTAACPTRIIPVTGPEIDRLIRENPFYAYATIPGGMYAGNDKDIKTFGGKATLVSSADVSDEIVYQLVKAVFDNFDNFKTLHPVFSTLTIEQMVGEGNTAPLHPGALRYYRERGWMN